VFTSGLFAVLTRTTTRDGSQVACLASHPPALYQHGSHPLSSHVDEKKFDVSIAAGRIDFLPHLDLLTALALGCVVFDRPARRWPRRVCKLAALASQLFNGVAAAGLLRLFFFFLSLLCPRIKQSILSTFENTHLIALSSTIERTSICIAFLRLRSTIWSHVV
jgi:hypothetical protein